VLLASGYTRLPVERGADTEFIPKPYQLSELARKIEGLL
jgi:hypothetical protein